MANDWLDINVEDVRDLVFDRGESFDLYRAAPCPCAQSQDVGEESARAEVCALGCVNGQIYTKFDVAPDVVAIVTDWNKTTYHPDFGRVPSGTAKWIGMADEVVLGDQDRVVLTSPARAELCREILKRDGLEDVLAHPEVVVVREVRLGTQTFELGTDYDLVSSAGDHKSSLVWLAGGTAPSFGEFYSVEYLRRPRLIFRADGNWPARGNMAGEILVQRVNLTILPLAKEGEMA